MKQALPSGLKPGPAALATLVIVVALLGLLGLLAVSGGAAGAAGVAEVELTRVSGVEGRVYDVAVAGDYAYLATAQGLQVVSISDPTHPSVVGLLKLEGGAASVAVAVRSTDSGGYVYVGQGQSLRVVEVGNPETPQEVGNLSTPGRVLGLVVAEGLAYLAAGEGGLRVVNISDPTAPREVGALGGNSNASGVALAGDLVVVAWGEGGLRAVDVSDPSKPLLVGVYELAGQALEVVVQGETAYVAWGESGLRAVSLQDPVNLSEQSSYQTLESAALGVAVEEDFAYLATGESGVQVLERFLPAAALPSGSYDTEGVAQGVAVAGQYLYVADGGGGLQVLYVNSLPVVTIFSISPTPASKGEPVTFRGGGFDSEGPLAAFRWRSSIAGLLSDRQDFTTANLSAGRHLIYFAVQDLDGAWSHEVSRSLQIGNARPTAQIDLFPGSPHHQGQRAAFRGTGEDQDGAVVEYQWNSSLEGKLSSAAAFSTDGLSPGDHLISFRVRDEDGAWSAWVNRSLHVNARPLLSGGRVAPIEGEAGADFTFTVVYLDPDASGPGQVRVLIGGVGGFDMADPRGEGTYQFSASLAWGYRNFSFSATDGLGGEAAGDIGVHPLYVNGRPSATINSISPLPAAEGENLTLLGSGYDPDGVIVGYRWRSSLNGPLGEGSNLTVGNLTAGNHTLYLEVVDDRGSWSLAAVRAITIGPAVEGKGPARVPLLSRPAVQAAAATTSLSLLGLASGYYALGETSRYRVWSLLAPLMVGRRRERRSTDPLANEIRGLIRGFLIANPGAHFGLLKEELALVNGTLAYHLQILEREELVTSEKRGRMRCFWAIGKGVGRANGHRLRPRPKVARWTGMGWRRSPEDRPEEGRENGPGAEGETARKRPRSHSRPVTQEKLLALIEAQPGISQTALAKAFGVTSAAVKYHIDAHIAAGRLRRERHGLQVAYYRESGPGRGPAG